MKNGSQKRGIYAVLADTKCHLQYQRRTGQIYNFSKYSIPKTLEYGVISIKMFVFRLHSQIRLHLNKPLSWVSI